MLEDHLKLAKPCRRLRSGPAGAYVDDFAEWLRERGYRANTRGFMLRSLASWTDWLAERSFSDGDFVAGYEACRTELAEHGRVRYQRSPNRNALAAAAALIRFLRERGVVAAAQQPLRPSERWPLLKQFRTWMLQHQGVRPSTMERYERYAADFIEALGVVPAHYSAAAVRGFVIARSDGHRVKTAQTDRDGHMLLPAVPRRHRAVLRGPAARGATRGGLPTRRHPSVP